MEVSERHARLRATQFRLEISSLAAVAMRRETSQVSFLMCPFYVRKMVPGKTTAQR